jgi:hypothetical protein
MLTVIWHRIDMALKWKLIALIILSAVIAYIVSAGIGIVLMEIYGKHVYTNALAEFLNSTSGTSADEFNFEWPLHYLLIHSAIFSIAWLFFGAFAFRKYGYPYWRYSLLSPVVYFLLTFDFVFPLYVLAIGFGGIVMYSKSASSGTNHITNH